MKTSRYDQQAERIFEHLRTLKIKARAVADPLLALDLEELNKDLEDWKKTGEALQQRHREGQLAGRTLEKENRHIRELLDAIPTGCLITDLQGIVLEANLAVSHLLGVKQKNIKGKPLYRFAAEGDRQILLDQLEQWSRGQAPSSRAEEVRFKSGKERTVWAAIQSRPLPGGKKKMTGLSWLVEDLSRRKGIEAEREAFIEILRIIYSADNKRDLIKLIIFYLQQWSGCQAVGIRLREGDDFPYYETSGFTKAFLLTENRLCVYDQDQELIRDSRGHPVLECMCGNILQGRFDPSLSFFTSFGSFWTNSTSELLATTSEADRQARTRNRCHGEGFESVALVPLNFKGNIAGLLQFNDRRKDRFTSEKIALFERLAKSIAIALAQRSAEENLKKSEERYRRLAEAAHDLIFVVDPEYKLTYVNSFAAKLFNLKQGDIIGRNMNEFFHPPTSERQRKNVEKVFQTNEPLYVEAESRLSLTTIWLGTWLVPIRDQGGQAKEVMGISRDITQRRRMEEELQHIFNLIPDMLCTASIDGYFKQLNPSWEKTLGFPLDELLSKSFAEFIHPDDLGPTLKEVEKQITGQSTINFNNRYLCKNGTYKWFEWNAIPSPDGELLYAVARDITKRKEMEDSLHETQKLLQAIASYTPDHIIVQDNQLRYLYVANPQLDLTEKEMIGKMDYDFLQPEEAARLTQVKKEVLRTGKAVHFETSLVSKAGGEEFFDGTFVPRFDSFGQADGLIGYFRNVTETKKVYDQLLASLKEKEVLLQEIHHRVKNNLQVISSLLNLQGHRLKDKEQQAVFQDSQNRIKSMALVHEQLYQSPDLSRVDFPEYLRKLTAMLFRTYERASSTIRLQITARGIFLQAAKAVPCGLIVNELVTNALKHAFPHNRSGTISIEVVPKGNQFRLTVQDNGVGLPETLDPLRSESLGLQIVQVLVKQLDGKLEFDRQRGTRFILRFSKEDKPSGSRTIFK